MSGRHKIWHLPRFHQTDKGQAIASWTDTSY